MNNYTFTDKELFENWNVDLSSDYPEHPYELIDSIIVPRWGVYDNGKLQIPSALQRMNGHLKHNPPTEIDNLEYDYEIDECFYISHMNSGHWGHFITESLARFYHVFHNCPTKNILINVFEDGIHLKNITNVLEELGFNVVYINPNHKNIKVGKLYFSKPTMINCYQVIGKHIDTLAKYRNLTCEVNPITNKKVYLSRTKLTKHKRWTFGEEELENMLLNAGWSIFHFESISLSEQLSIISGAGILTGCIGSAFHNMMLSPFQPKKVVYLTNNEKDTNPNYALHDRVLKNESIYYACQDCIDRGAGINKIRNPQEVFEYLEDACK